MSRVGNLARWLYDRGLLRYLPWRFLKHNVFPVTERRRRQSYDAATYFESWYRTSSPQGLSDRLTISPRTTEAQARFHYNATEMSIIRFFARSGYPIAPRVLDIGSGTGHWIDFYRDVFGASGLVGVELSPTCREFLAQRYTQSDDVSIVGGDVSSPEFVLEGRFDLINAVGVMFHIVDDEAWARAIGHCARCLEPGGHLVVGGQFGWRTVSVQFHEVDTFSSWEGEESSRRQGSILVNKRIRSRRLWKRIARRHGLRLIGVVSTFSDSAIVTPENNVAVFRRERPGRSSGAAGEL